MDKKDYKYIFRRVLTFFIIFVILSFIKSCEVKAATYKFPQGDITIENSNWYSNYGYYGTNITTSGTSINFTLMCNQNNYNDFYCMDATAIVVDACVGSGIADFKRTANYGSSCPNSCFTNTPFFQELNQTCDRGNNTTGFMFRFYLPILKWNVGSGNTPYYLINDNMKFYSSGYNTGIMFTNVYITDELFDANSNFDTINTQIGNLNSSINSASNQAHQDAQQAHQDSQNTQNAINDAKNQAHQDSQEMKNTITDTSSPTNLNSLSQSAGWLPAGPVDSILNLPLSLLNNLSSNLSKNCQPVVLPIPLINSNLTLPCVKTLYHDMGIETFINWVGGIASAFILLAYLLKLYKWVDNTLTFRENNQIDNWGGI